MDSIKLNEMIMDILSDKKAHDVISIDVRKVTTLTDFLIICTGTSDRHRKSLSDEVHEKMDEINIEIISKEGYNYSDWILLDLGDVIVNIFDKESRSKYSLERLWSDGVLTELRRGEGR